MGFRFFKRIKILPGLTLNLSKNGFSFSAGPRGAKYTAGTSGERATVGIPGTGLFYTKKIRRNKNEDAEVQEAKQALRDLSQQLNEDTVKFSRPIDNFEIYRNGERYEKVEPEGVDRNAWLDGLFLVATSQEASLSQVRKKLKINYSTAASIIEKMEMDELIGPYIEGAARSVYISIVINPHHKANKDI